VPSATDCIAERVTCLDFGVYAKAYISSTACRSDMARSCLNGLIVTLKLITGCN
jgi:hypothetical protein